MPAALEAATLPDALREVAREWSELNEDPGRGHRDRRRRSRSTPRSRSPCCGRPRRRSRTWPGTPRRGARRLTLSYMGDEVTLDVRDDGVGFDGRRAGDAAPAVRVRPPRHAPAGRAGGGLARDRVGAGRRDGGLGARPGHRGRRRRRRRRREPDPRADRRRPPGRPRRPPGHARGRPDFEVVGEAGDGDEALALVDALAPDVVLMDLRMPGRRRRRRSGPWRERVPARVLVLTTYDSDSDVVPALEAGATGYLLKDAPRDELRPRRSTRRRAARRCSRRRSRPGW